MAFLEVHDDTPDSLCERIRPTFHWDQGYLMDEGAREAAARWRGQAKEIRFFEGEKPPREQKYHDMKPYRVLQMGDI